MDEFYHPYSCRVKAPIGQIGAFRFSSITPVGHSAPTIITMKIGSPRPEPQPGPLDSRESGNDGAEAGRHFHPRMWLARAWVIIMKIDANRHSGAGRNPGVGRWTPAFARVMVGRLAAIFILVCGPQWAWVITMKIDTHQHRHSRESGNPGSRDVGGHCESPTPQPWIPAYAGMTVGADTRHFHPRMWPAGGWVIPAQAGMTGRRSV